MDEITNLTAAALNVDLAKCPYKKLSVFLKHDFLEELFSKNISEIEQMLNDQLYIKKFGKKLDNIYPKNIFKLYKTLIKYEKNPDKLKKVKIDNEICLNVINVINIAADIIIKNKLLGDLNKCKSFSKKDKNNFLDRHKNIIDKYPDSLIIYDEEKVKKIKQEEKQEEKKSKKFSLERKPSFWDEMKISPNSDVIIKVSEALFEPEKEKKISVNKTTQ